MGVPVAHRDDVHAVYTRLIAKLGKRIEGLTTIKREMLIADVLGEEPEKFSKKIQRALRGEFGVSYDGGFVGFPGMDDYDFIGSDTAEATTGIDRDVAAKIRAEATKLRDREISKRIGIAKG